MKENSNELRELIRRFRPEEAERTAAEIEQIEARIAAFASPSMRPERAHAVRSRCIEQMSEKKTPLWGYLSVAAACLAAVAGLLLLQKTGSVINQSPLPVAAVSWEETLSGDAYFVTEAADELEDISNQLYELRAAQWDSSSPRQEDAAELEDAEWIYNTSFWKG